MEYYREVMLKNGKKCILRNAEQSDAEAFLYYFETAHAETEYLTTYPEESEHDVEKTSEVLLQTKLSAKSVEVCAFVDGLLVGSAGDAMIQNREKTRHRAGFGISILKPFWGLGIGDALTESCIECAKQAGYLQLELDVVAENESAQHLYKKHGFVEYGRNPRGFRKRDGNWQELVLMRLELDSETLL